MGKSISLAALIFVLSCKVVSAQATAGITGTVKDQSGAVLPGVEIRATQTDTGIARDTITNETGSYVLPNLPIGPYRLDASLPGFRTYAQSGIVLQVNTSPAINIALDVGQVAETVEVQANAALVETRNAGVGSVVENARILELPLNGRQIIELVSLAGGATPAPTINPGGRDPFNKVNFSVAGGLNTGLNYTLDGAVHNNPYDAGYFSTPFPDALQEFKVETGATGAQNGVKPSGTVSLVTKSGTNNFHGALFEFVRNGKFNARNAFATKRDTIKRNQFGGTLGGPIAANRMFFFGGYQGTTFRQDPSDLIGFVPTSAMLAGDFTAFASPACNAGRAITLRAPFVNNRIDPAQFSKPAVVLSAKLPNTSDPCGKTIYGKPRPEDGHMALGRIDYQKSSNHSIFGRYLAESITIPPSYNLTNNLLSNISLDGSAGEGNTALAQAFTLGDTYLFSSNVVNAFRFSANRFGGDKPEPRLVGHRELGINVFSYYPTKMSVNVTGGFSFGSNGGATRVAVFSANDDLSVLRGNHQLALGTIATVWWANSYTNNFANGSMSFNGQATGLGMADYLVGRVTQFQMGTPSIQNKRANFIALYGTDTWKLNDRLTLNYGLRWEPYLPIVHVDKSVSHFDMNALRKGIKTTLFDNAPPGIFYNGDPGFPGQEGMYKQWWNFSPRVGLAWDVAGDGRTSIRASGGTFYDYPTAYYFIQMSSAPPWNPRIALLDVSFENPWANYPGGDPLPTPYGRHTPRNARWPQYGLVNAIDYDAPNMQVAQWNLSLQKQIGTDWLASATYVGNARTHLFSTQQMNPATYIPGGPCTLNSVTYNPCSTTGNTDQRRRLSLENPAFGQYIGLLNRVDTGGTASYNGLILSIQRRAARGFTINSNYTWSHCITDPGGDIATSQGSGNTAWTNPDNRTFDRGNCSLSGSDRHHVVNFSAVAETPRFSNPTLRAVGSGWRLSPLFKVLSGDYMTVTTSVDRALNGIALQRLDQVLGNPYGDKSVNSYLNPAAFALPALGTLGNAGAASIAGPGTWQFDTSLSRIFQFHETQQLEFRTEAFNVTNSFRMNNPTTNFSVNTFGQVTTAKDPRILQFALKYIF